jgi:hypothetical protein
MGSGSLFPIFSCVKKGVDNICSDSHAHSLYLSLTLLLFLSPLHDHPKLTKPASLDKKEEKSKNRTPRCPYPFM